MMDDSRDTDTTLYSTMENVGVMKRGNLLQLLIFHTTWPRPRNLSRISILTNPSARAGYDTRSIFKRTLTGLN